VDPRIYQKVDAALCPVMKAWKPVAVESRNTIKFSFTAQRAADFPVCFSTTLMGDVVSSMFSSSCLDADSHIFQTVDMSIHPAHTPPPLPMSSSSTTAVAPTHASSSASQIQRDMAPLDDMYQDYMSESGTDAGTLSGSDDEETNM
jgi:hypothetical protein